MPTVRRSWTSWLVPLLVLALGVLAGLATALLYRDADTSRRAQTELIGLRLDQSNLVQGAFAADVRSGGSPTRGRMLIRAADASIRRRVAVLRVLGSTPGTLDGLEPLLRALDPTVQRLYAIGSSEGFTRSPDTNRLLASVAGQQARIGAVLDRAAARYDASVSSARTRATAGSAATLALLLGAFLVLYRRSGLARAQAEALAQENAGLLEVSRSDAVTDALTGLHNRRALNDDFAQLLTQAADDADGEELLLAMFDLDGFKQYNDTFGHPAGDALLVRLGRQLHAAAPAGATTYRMGGDEFCVLARTSAEDGARLVDGAVDALSSSGEGWRIGCSSGLVWLPTEARDLEEALRIVDQRLYADKASRMSASRQTASALVQVLAERSDGLEGHSDAVADLSTALALDLGLEAQELQQVELAAKLHDIGKAAVPDAILDKPGPLDDAEWAFIRRHTEIGERILLAAPSMQEAALMVRSSHERIDGDGYPDGLVGEEIPVGARIVAVADAFHAMVSVRPYGRTCSEGEAIAELQRCAGTQFDARIVAAFVRVRTQLAAHAA